MFFTFSRDRTTSAAVRRGPMAAMAMLVMAAILSLTAIASATVMTYADLITLIEDADVIVHGRIEDQQTYFDKSRGFVVTDTTLSVQTGFFGTTEAKVTFQQWGGQYEDRTYQIPGDPSFERGEEVILFLTRSEKAPQRLHLTALSQAKYRVIRNEAGHTLVMRDMRDVAILFEDGAGTRIGHVQDPPTKLTYFIAELETLVAGIKGGLQ
jgi:hypothetical protein